MSYGLVKSIALAALSLVIFTALAMAISDKIIKRDNFCVSCHLPSGKPLHQAKMEMMTSKPPLSLAGVHFQNKKSPLGCPECHHGTNLTEQITVFWFQTKNTLLYFTGRFEEPRTLEAPVTDRLCASCHHDLKVKAVEFKYHSFMSHDGLKQITCTTCHPAHSAPVEGGGFLDKDKILLACALCHKNPGQSAPLQKSLGLPLKRTGDFDDKRGSSAESRNN